MLFNSISFAIYLPIVFLLYWFVFDRFISGAKHQLRLQNAFVVVASYVFYGWWDWRFLFLIAFTTLCSWGSGLLIGKARSEGKAKAWMWLNVALNLGILVLFKYYDFFVTEFAQLFNISTDGLLLKVILPIGISFYTFQALSYSIDVYRDKIEPTKDIIAFFAFISFFPQLVAGPIERATNLLPQFLKRREFSYDTATDGIRQMLWGLFKKIVVADNCAVFVDQIFASYTEQSGSALLLGAILFTFQIYGDFSGYSDIAIGTAKLFGINIRRNFNNPFFALNIADYWRRWHISLTSWLTDYLFTPLNIRFRNWGKSGMILAIVITMVLIGLWHGANWTFVLFGLYHGLLYIPLILSGAFMKKAKLKTNSLGLPVLSDLGRILLTFALVVVGLIIFRSENLAQVWDYIRGMFQFGTLKAGYRFFTWHDLWPSNLYIVIMIIVEWMTRKEEHSFAIQNMDMNKWVRRAIYIAVALILFYCGHFDSNQFIYFQF
jgi:D-alanyl-lipoteichoic acid acyltransferase DltB (MBOAT superfamily)